MKILVVEDEIKLNQSICRLLEHKGYAVDAAHDGEEGERMAKINEYDLIILDIMMPKRDGLEICKNIRVAKVKSPIIFLTAKDTTQDKIKGLNEGADDYMVKPFSLEELLARVRALLRRPQLTNGDILNLDELTLNTRSQKVSINTKEVTLTLREYALLEYFLRNQGTVLTQSDILEHVWNQFHDPLSNTVYVHLKNLRKKLPKPYAQRIKTVWGKGYKLI